MSYPWQSTWRQLIVGLSYALEDGVEGTASALGTTTTMIDTTKAGADGDWEGSELFFFDVPEVGHQVTGYAAGSGTFTFRPALAAAVTAGMAYLIGNIRGQGFPHARKLAALQHALRLARWRVDTSDSSLVTSGSTWEYTIPASFATLYKVEVLRGGTSQPWVELSPAKWWVRQPTRTLVLSGSVGGAGGYTLRLTGRGADVLPAAMTDVVRVPSEWVVDTAAAWLLRSRGNPADRQLAAALYNERARSAPQQPWRANEVALDLVA